ncbi:chemotaxis protein CheB [Methylobacterium sp. SyP6R]|uniref:chemotaxis protein CheB n=1 Tax=Methylobacterium sp. SyP6R TaxID=2718876 RepID=UPI001F1973B7|nr:chemotaxis protein CheB [Methylobacterium sp. SyP6R]MCF4126270.1 hypothetical protein [Methylobacterium sp. SyP6R]
MARKTRAEPGTDGADERPGVVGVGTSGAAIESLGRFLADASEMPGVAVMVALQQRDAIDAVRRRTGLAPAPVETGHLDLLPEDGTVALVQGRFRLAATDNPGGRGSLDTVLVSLGEDQAASAGAAVLAVGDGTLGITAIEAAGGLTLAEPHSTTS